MANQSIIVPQSQAPVLNAQGWFTTVWYNFFTALAREVPQVGDCIIQANGIVSDGYLRCNGAAVGRELYAPLFAVIGTTYGPGDGSTTFNLPTFATPGAPGYWKIRFK